MESRLIANADIYWKLGEEFAAYIEHCTTHDIEQCETADGWGDFIKHMNMGVVWRDDISLEDDIYEVIDEHLYMLAKIRWGF